MSALFHLSRPKVITLAALLICCGSNKAPVPSSPVSVAVQGVAVRTINSSFLGLSYEKSKISNPLFNANNTGLVALFQKLGAGVFRIGGNSVDQTTWNASAAGGVSGTVAPADIDRLAGFLRAANWQVIYGINLGQNSTDNAAAEAAYAVQSLGDRLLGLEIGNEPDLYAHNGIRPTTYKYADFKAEWESYAAAIRALVPTAPLTGPAAASNAGTYTVPFAADEASKNLLLTQHYYRANGQVATSTISLLLEPDPALISLLDQLDAAATGNHLPGGYRMAECNSFYNGGAPGVSDGFGTALWTLDYLFTNALHDSAGVNFHGGGDGSGYTPIADDGKGQVDGVRPVYYGMFLFSLAGPGSLLSTTVNAGSLVLTAYAIERADQSISLVVINKDPDIPAAATITLPRAFTAGAMTLLTAPSLESTSGYLIGGAPIGNDGSWSAPSPQVVAVQGTAAQVTVPPASAALIRFQ